MKSLIASLLLLFFSTTQAACACERGHGASADMSAPMAAGMEHCEHSASAAEKHKAGDHDKGDCHSQNLAASAVKANLQPMDGLAPGSASIQLLNISSVQGFDAARTVHRPGTDRLRSPVRPTPVTLKVRLLN